jgi:hypothetical protein
MMAKSHRTGAPRAGQPGLARQKSQEAKIPWLFLRAREGGSERMDGPWSHGGPRSNRQMRIDHRWTPSANWPARGRPILRANLYWPALAHVGRRGNEKSPSARPVPGQPRGTSCKMRGFLGNRCASFGDFVDFVQYGISTRAMGDDRKAKDSGLGGLTACFNQIHCFSVYRLLFS